MAEPAWIYDSKMDVWHGDTRIPLWEGDPETWQDPALPPISRAEAAERLRGTGCRFLLTKGNDPQTWTPMQTDGLFGKLHLPPRTYWLNAQGRLE